MAYEDWRYQKQPKVALRKKCIYILVIKITSKMVKRLLLAPKRLILLTSWEP